MTTAIAPMDASRFGKVEARKLALEEIGDHFRSRSVTNVTRYTWRPTDKMIAEIPYVLGLDCIEENGNRRFTIPDVPSAGDDSTAPRYMDNTTDFVLLASVGGAKILESQKIAPVSEVLNYDSARVFLQYSWGLREWLGETRDLSKILHVDSKGRSDPTTRTILPEDLGLDILGNGSVWSLNQLIETGERTVRLASVPNPSTEQVLRYGLLEAARIAPLYLTGDDVQWITRSALFALPERKCPLTNTQLKFVADRAIEALSGHLEDSNEKFREWLEDGKSSLSKFISRLSKSLVTRVEARLGLLELGWESYRVVGQCVDAQMRAFRELLPDLLNEKEQLMFDSIFLENPALAGLPFVTLHKRLSFLPQALVNYYWKDPTDVLACSSSGIGGADFVRDFVHSFFLLSPMRRG